ncbi:flagellar biosynthesis anti-sigma factor FlgM [Methylomarinum sp. Ch1-1]|uniref:Negative regulator of flagellin synthesis n=1 Tax=Methylomarinum roseum TaxID=3067653 RepID=A0AAU7NUI0_9GAMM|nr:flagellar biosynthesis anti-sigma factor FlgM [Methylomarinum sp. Ch1-1]MDP4519267.1 flagellar biosynthesis anti-sigma factor FlgM [Methylomarinum sp. Ch1-1]
MAINSITGKTNNVALTATENKKEKPENESKIGADSTKTDKIDITSLTQEIKKAFETASSTPAIDHDKVAAVKAALQNGNYQINADSIAEKMLQLDRHFDNN